MKISDDQKLKEESFLDMLNKQYLESANKEEIDYWEPLTKIIMESIELRDSKKMTQADLAKKMKTRQSVISRFENMGRLPNYDFISRLSFALGHKLGITLYGDYMAVVPIDKQNLVKKMADEKNITTESFIQDLLVQSIDFLSSYNSEMISATIEDIYVKNKQQQEENINKSLLLTSNDTETKINDNSMLMAS